MILSGTLWNWGRNLGERLKAAKMRFFSYFLMFGIKIIFDLIMKSYLARLSLKFLKIGGIVVGALLLLMFLLPYLFPGFVSQKIRDWAKGSVRTELKFSAARLSFFKHFPALTL